MSALTTKLLIAPQLVVPYIDSTTLARSLLSCAHKGALHTSGTAPTDVIRLANFTPVYLDKEGEKQLINETAVLQHLTKSGAMPFHEEQMFECAVVDNMCVSDSQINALLFLDRCVIAKFSHQQVALLMEIESDAILLSSVRSLIGLKKAARHVELSDAIYLFGLKKTTACSRIQQVQDARHRLSVGTSFPARVFVGLLDAKTLTNREQKMLRRMRANLRKGISLATLEGTLLPYMKAHRNEPLFQRFLAEYQHANT